jgi:gas vesicle protein
LKFLKYHQLVKFACKEDKMKRITSFFVGAMMGVLVGGTLALLLAPSSGNELRNQMQDRVERLREEIRRAAADRRDELEAQLAALRAPKTVVD